MKSFKEWLKLKLEVMSQGSMVDKNDPELDANHRGAMPYYSVSELPPTPKHRQKKKMKK